MRSSMGSAGGTYPPRLACRWSGLRVFQLAWITPQAMRAPALPVGWVL